MLRPAGNHSREFNWFKKKNANTQGVNETVFYLRIGKLEKIEKNRKKQKIGKNWKKL